MSWTTPLTGLPFWWPLPVLGFHPTWIVTAHAVSLAYQCLLHTQLSLSRFSLLLALAHHYHARMLG